MDQQFEGIKESFTMQFMDSQQKIQVIYLNLASKAIREDYRERLRDMEGTLEDKFYKLSHTMIKNEKDTQEDGEQKLKA